MNTSKNSRTKETRKKIEDEFLLLLEKEKIEKITVKELCARVRINPSTFYFHYKDIYDLMKQMEIDFSSKIDNAFWNVENQRYQFDFTRYIEMIEQNRKFYKVYLSRNGKLFTLNKDKVAQSLGEKKSKQRNVEEIYQYYFYLGGATSVIKAWLDNECDVDKKIIVDLIEKKFAEQKN